MQRPHWNAAGVLARSWELLRQHPLPLAGSTGLFLLACGLPVAAVLLLGLLAGRASPLLEPVFSLLIFMLLVLLLVVAVFLGLGLARILLKTVAGETPGLADLFSELPTLPAGLTGLLLAGCGVGVGLPLCILPGVVLFLGWMFTPLIVVERDMGPLEAMRESWRLSEGERLPLLRWLAVCAGLLLGGTLICGLGLLLALPLCGLGTTLIYKNCSAAAGR